MKNIQPPSGIRAEIEKLLYEFDPGGYVEEIDLAKWEALITRERKAAVEEALGKACDYGNQWEWDQDNIIKTILSEMFPTPHADQ